MTNEMQALLNTDGEIADLPIDALPSFARLVEHTTICSWCNPHHLCSIGESLAAPVDAAYGSYTGPRVAA